MTLFSRLVFGHEKVSVGVQKPSKKKWKKVVETENFFRAKSVMEYFSLSFLTPYNYSFPLFLLFLSYFTFMEKESSFEAFKRKELHLQYFHIFIKALGQVSGIRSQAETSWWVSYNPPKI